jgi:hypothetical protein
VTTPREPSDTISHRRKRDLSLYLYLEPITHEVRVHKPMRAFFRATTVPFLLGILTVSSVGQSSSLVIQELKSPAGAASGEPNIYKGADGRIYLTWIEKNGEKIHALRFAARTGGAWSAPQTIIEGEDLFVNWADFPSLVALPSRALVAHWLVKSSPGGHAYDVNISRSMDDGKSWSKPVAPHRDGTKTEHGFVSMLPWVDGRVGAVWLDGRNFKENGHEGHGPSANQMTLRFATIDANSKVSEDVVLDSRVCECCQTSAALTSEGAIVVYRDRSEKEIRDISVVRFSKGRWTEPRTVNADGWEIQGCPVNGPSVSADGKRVAIAWFTAAKETPRVKVVFSSDAGATLASPIPVDEGSPVGRVDVLMLTDGSALVSWLERTAKGGEVKVRRVRPDGSRDEAITVAESSAARVSGFPQMARAGDEIIFAWTDPGVPSRVRTAVGRFGAGR